MSDKTEKVIFLSRLAASFGQKSRISNCTLENLFPIRHSASLTMVEDSYKVVRLANGTHSIYSEAEDETFHPVIGPVAEAQALYVNQLKLRQRMAEHKGEFIVWDVGLGAGANVLTVFNATRDIPVSLRVLSFDRTAQPMAFALSHASELGYVSAYQEQAQALLQNQRVCFENGRQSVEWEFHLGDFPQLITSPEVYPAPHAILFDAFSPAKNPAMWTAPLFTNIFRRLEPAHPCAMPTYSRSTMLRVTLLLSGFYVGVGHATGEKEETTIAANDLKLLDEPLPRQWLQRVAKSRSAEPLWEPHYRQAPISPASFEKLQNHPQFTI